MVVRSMTELSKRGKLIKKVEMLTPIAQQHKSFMLKVLIASFQCVPLNCFCLLEQNFLDMKIKMKKEHSILMGWNTYLKVLNSGGKVCRLAFLMSCQQGILIVNY